MQCNACEQTKNTKLRNTKIEKTNVKLTAYGGQRINVIGKCNLNCKFAHREYANLEFIITQNTDDQPVIIGLPSLMKLNIVQRVHNIESKDESSLSGKILTKYKKHLKV